jgi:hypothetical protein
MPSESGGVEAILHGDLARILALCSTGAAAVKEAMPLRAVLWHCPTGVSFLATW